MNKNFSPTQPSRGAAARLLLRGLVRWLVGVPEGAEVARLSDRARRDMGLDPP
ncbi:hypothetical protein [Caenispirillum bisanense]|uniref:hypothetical protein n=1 Tax=Caenispirillum bisanense TaxID=414052 RepID=UPI0031D7F148